MDTQASFIYGQSVRIVARLGLVDGLHGGRFIDDVVEPGAIATYAGPHPSPELKLWHMLKVDVDGRELYAPVTDDHFEAIA